MCRYHDQHHKMGKSEWPYWELNPQPSTYRKLCSTYPVAGPSISATNDSVNCVICLLIKMQYSQTKNKLIIDKFSASLRAPLLPHLAFPMVTPSPPFTSHLPRGEPLSSPLDIPPWWPPLLPSLHISPVVNPSPPFTSHFPRGEPLSSPTWHSPWWAPLSGPCLGQYRCDPVPYRSSYLWIPTQKTIPGAWHSYIDRSPHCNATSEYLAHWFI